MYTELSLEHLSCDNIYTDDYYFPWTVPLYHPCGCILLFVVSFTFVRVIQTCMHLKLASATEFLVWGCKEDALSWHSSLLSNSPSSADGYSSSWAHLSKDAIIIKIIEVTAEIQTL